MRPKKQGLCALEYDRYLVAVPGTFNFDPPVKPGGIKTAQALPHIVSAQSLAGLNRQRLGKRLQPDAVYTFKFHRLDI